jgi:hypothetical protein
MVIVCAPKDEKYYGFVGHVVISFDEDNLRLGYTFASENVDESDVLQDVPKGLSGLLLGDKGFITSLLKEPINSSD